MHKEDTEKTFLLYLEVPSVLSVSITKGKRVICCRERGLTFAAHRDREVEKAESILSLILLLYEENKKIP
jgi:hypothetical protein